MLTIGHCVVVTLRLRGCRRQADKIRRAIFAAPVQERRAAQRNRRPLRPRPEQHRQHSEQHIIADNDVGWEVLQHLLHALVLGRNGIDEHPLHGNAEPFQSRRNGFQFGSHRREITQIKVRAGRKRVKGRADAFNRAAQSTAR